MFIRYQVTADYVSPKTPWVDGVGAECSSANDALELAANYRKNPNLTNVQTRTIRCGMD